jgi:hypothetical protein
MDASRTPAHELLAAMPPARRHAAIRAASAEIVSLLASVFTSVGFPSEDRWTPVVGLDLEAVRQCILAPKELPKETS